MFSLLLILNFTATAVMTGVIWTIQLVHYPFFHRVDKDDFGSHMDEHRKKISFIVMPVMLLELASAIGLVLIGSNYKSIFIVALFLLALIWLSTALLQVPAHAKLATGYSKTETNKLVKSNWVRSLLWTFRLSILLYILSYQSFFHQ
jgi:hypothetical protein